MSRTFERVDLNFLQDWVDEQPISSPAYGILDALRAAYTEMDRMAATSNEAADILRTGAYDEDDDLLTLARNAHDAQVHLLGQSDKYRLEAKDLAADRDRLRASALNWVTVTDDPTTLPEEHADVLILRAEYEGDPDSMPQCALLPSHEFPEWHSDFDGDVEVVPGDRWTYIPKPPDQFVDANKTIPEAQS